VREIEAARAIRATVLASSDSKAFCAGADLSSVVAGKSSALILPEGGLAGLVLAKRTKPWIAAVSGWALGGGFELVLACDMVVAADNSQFGLPEVSRGLLAGSGGVSRLPRRIPRAIALEMITTGKPVDAHRAYTLGLVNKVTSCESLQIEALAMARTIARGAPRAVREGLELAHAAADQADCDMTRRTMAASDAIRSGSDAIEGAAAFLERRPAVWTEF
jgi:enoyl-CoA hydratase